MNGVENTILARRPGLLIIVTLGILVASAKVSIHLVQADLYHLPFREGSFDFAYSVGPLHWHYGHDLKDGRKTDVR